MLTDTFDRSLWYATAREKCETPPLAESSRCDVAVIGAGFLGLSTALHLAERGASVVVLDAREPGFGASGRNTGFVVPSFSPSVGPGDVFARFGREQGERLCHLIGDAGRTVFELIRKHQIRCEPVEAGWLQPAHTPAKVAHLEERQKEWAAVGKSIEVVGRDDAVRLTGSTGYYGALVDATGGHVNPLGYARGLTAAAVARGARIYGDSPVIGLTSEARGWRVVTPKAEIRAERVVIATNAMGGKLLPEVSRSILPLGVYQVATEPLEPANRKNILPDNHCISDTRRNVFALRWAPEQRLVTGGMMAVNAAGLTRASTLFASRLRRLLPIVGPCKAAFTWHGVIAVTTDWFPRIYDLGRGGLAVISCCGRGLALTTVLGREIAEYFTGGAETDLPVPISNPDPIRARYATIRAAPAYLLWARFRDWSDVHFARA